MRQRILFDLYAKVNSFYEFLPQNENNFSLFKQRYYKNKLELLALNRRLVASMLLIYLRNSRKKLQLMQKLLEFCYILNKNRTFLHVTVYCIEILLLMDHLTRVKRQTKARSCQRYLRNKSWWERDCSLYLRWK